uniref:Uncharacterized protein n=1 Tax=Megaselia scalaris TaxID=36166 RepID=T1GRX7_MEGSC
NYSSERHHRYDDHNPVPSSAPKPTPTQSTSSSLYYSNPYRGYHAASMSPMSSVNHTVSPDAGINNDVESGRGAGGSGGDGSDSDRNSVSSGSLTQQLQSHLTNNSGTTNGHLALMYHNHQLSNFPVLPVIKKQPPRPYFGHEQRHYKIK